MNSSIIKFEKSVNYLTNQLNTQENNKQLLLDIVANIGIIRDSKSSSDNLELLIDTANEFLNEISENITIINELKLEISSITKELTDVLSDKNRNSKSKEYYISTFSTIKNNILKFTEKYQNFQIKLEESNDDLNEFISVNNFKYTYNLENNSDNKYELASFSVNDDEIVQNQEKNDLTLLEFDNFESDVPEFNSNKNEKNVINAEKDVIETKEDTQDEIEELDLSEEIDESLLEDFLLENISEEEMEGIEDIEPEKPKNPNSYSDLKNELNNIFNEINGITIPEINEDDIDTSEIDLDDIPIDEIDLDDISIDEINLDDVPTDEINNEDFEKNLENNNDIQDNTLQISDENSIIENSIFDEYSSYEPSALINTNEEEKDNSQNESENTIDNVLKGIEEFEIEIPEKSNFDGDLSLFGENETDISLDDVDIDDFFISDTNDRESDTTIEEIADIIVENKEENIEVEETEDINAKIRRIINAEQDNNDLIISERTNCVFLPYTMEDLINFLNNYPDDYSSLSDVVDQEYILSFDYFMKHPVKSRFEETYNLLKNRNGKSSMYALNYALKIVKMDNLNPAIIAACRTEKELESYLYLLSSNSTRKFKCFNIIYDINPL